MFNGDESAEVNVLVDDDNSKSSKDDDDRREMPWEERQENLMKGWMSEMNISAKLHKKAGAKNKTLYACFSIPAVLIPIVMSGITPILTHPIITSMLMILTGIFTGVSTFFNFGRKSQHHFDFENRYSCLSKEIQKELRKPKRFRIASDVYLEKIFQELCGINSNAPVV
jgi:hypothetical protein